MIETRMIATSPGLLFDVSVGGGAPAPLVLMLHGFCVSRHFWENQIAALAAAGYFVVAPNPSEAAPLVRGRTLVDRGTTKNRTVA
jgi:pimeloyl-ACP methyl ester carboxylesterase